MALAACAYEISAADPSWIQLTPAGQFHARDGRPRNLPGLSINDWTCDAACAAEVIALFRNQAVRPVVDYEHQTIKAEDNGQPAPAAGWIVDLAWREGQGLFAKVEWTARASALIAAGEYRYVSPVFAFDPKTGRLQRMHMAALTNNPALDGMQELTLRAAARFINEETDVDLKQLLAALCAILGVTGDATVETVIAAAKVAKTRADQADTQIAALKAQAPDPAQFVPIATFEDVKGQLATLQGEATNRDVAALVDEGITGGKLLPAQKDWATSLGKSDIAALKSYLDATAPIEALRNTQTKGKKPEDSEREGGLSSTELALCTAMGITPEQFKKAAA